MFVYIHVWSMYDNELVSYIMGRKSRWKKTHYEFSYEVS